MSAQNACSEAPLSTIGDIFAVAQRRVEIAMAVQRGHLKAVEEYAETKTVECMRLTRELGEEREAAAALRRRIGKWSEAHERITAECRKEIAARQAAEGQIAQAVERLTGLRREMRIACGHDPHNTDCGHCIRREWLDRALGILAPALAATEPTEAAKVDETLYRWRCGPIVGGKEFTDRLSAAKDHHYTHCGSAMATVEPVPSPPQPAAPQGGRWFTWRCKGQLGTGFISAKGAEAAHDQTTGHFDQPCKPTITEESREVTS